MTPLVLRPWTPPPDPPTVTGFPGPSLGRAGTTDRSLHMSHARTALASLAGLALSVGMVTGAATLSSADEARGKEKAPCSQEQKQYDKAVDKYERLHAKFATEKQEAAEAEGTDDEKAEKRQARKAKKAKKKSKKKKKAADNEQKLF